MFIKIPHRYTKYVRLLAKPGRSTDDEVCRAVFEDGLDEAESDIWMGATEPDMDMAVLDGRQTAIEIDDKPEYRARLEFISQVFNLEPGRAASTTFLIGLTEQWLALKGSSRYLENEHFREIIDQMPHERAYDETILPAAKGNVK